MTAVDRPDNGQDEGQWRVGSHYGIHVYKGGDPVATFLRPEDAREAVDAVNAQIAARAGAGEQQREQVARWLVAFDGHGDEAHDWAAAELGMYLGYADELLALLGAPQPDGEAEPCPVYSHGTDGWHCAVTGDHDQHTNAAGDVTW